MRATERPWLCAARDRPQLQPWGAAMEEVPISVQKLERFAPLVGDAPVAALEAAA